MKSLNEITPGVMAGALVVLVVIASAMVISLYDLIKDLKPLPKLDEDEKECPPSVRQAIRDGVARSRREWEEDPHHELGVGA